MKESQPITISDIEKKVSNLFTTLTPKQKNPRQNNITITVGRGYSDLLDKVESLIMVSISAMEAKEASISIHHQDEHIIQVLSLAKEFIPHPEMEFLDEIKENLTISS